MVHMTTITLEELIDEGKEIRKGISFVPAPDGVWRTYSVYHLKSTSEYEVWKNKTLRFLSTQFPEDRCISDFEIAIEEFTKSRCSPDVFNKMIGIMESCVCIPTVSSIQGNKLDKSININVNQSQTQSQQQSLALDIFIEAIKDELTGKQQKEIKEIITNEPNPIQAKTKLIDKIKSFGSDIASNIIANIITNPTIFGNF